MLINDVFVKGTKKGLSGQFDKDGKFLEQITAANELFRYWHDHGIMKEKALRYAEYEDIIYFLIDTEDLIDEEYPAAEENEKCRLILDEYFNCAEEKQPTPCEVCGCIEMGWTMHTFRDECGCVSRSWECSMCQGFSNDVIYQIMDIREKYGVKTAALFAWSLIKWDGKQISAKL